MQVLLVSRHVTQLCKVLIPILCPARNQFTILLKTALGTKMDLPDCYLWWWDQLPCQQDISAHQHCQAELHNVGLSTNGKRETKFTSIQCCQHFGTMSYITVGVCSFQ